MTPNTPETQHDCNDNELTLVYLQACNDYEEQARNLIGNAIRHMESADAFERSIDENFDDLAERYLELQKTKFIGVSEKDAAQAVNSLVAELSENPVTTLLTFKYGELVDSIINNNIQPKPHQLETADEFKNSKIEEMSQLAAHKIVAALGKSKKIEKDLIKKLDDRGLEGKRRRANAV